MNFSLFDIARDSLKLAWKHKILWIVALVIGTGGFSSRLNIPSDSEDRIPKETNRSVDVSTLYRGVPIDEIEAPAMNFSEDDTDVDMESFYDALDAFETSEDSSIGPGSENDAGVDSTPAATSEPASEGPRLPFENVLGLATSTVPTAFANPHLFDLLGPGDIIKGIVIVLIVLVLAAFGVFVSLFVSSWGLGAILGGVMDAIEGADKIELSNLGSYGRIALKQIIKFRIYIGLRIVIPLILTFVFFVAGTLVLASSGTSLGLLVFLLPFSLVPVIVLIPYYIALHYSALYGMREISYRGVPFKQAYANGRRTFSKFKGKSLGMSIVNLLVLLALGFFLVVAVVLIGIIVALMFGVIASLLRSASAGTLAGVLLVLTPFVLLLGFSALAALTAIKGFTTTYLYFVWSFMFKKTEEGLSNG